MAEGRGFEPLIAFLRSLGLASRHDAALSAFRGGVGRSRTCFVSLYRRVHSSMLRRRQMVGQVGLEPTESPRSERGAFANLTTARWSARSDSNRHRVAPRATASASWATRGEKWAWKDSNLHSPRFERGASASWTTGPWRSVRDSNPQPVGYGVAVFKTADLPIGLTLRTLFSCMGRRRRYDSRDRKDRLRSERYGKPVSRMAPQIMRTCGV
jgi:hypothetical protein